MQRFLLVAAVVASAVAMPATFPKRSIAMERREFFDAPVQPEMVLDARMMRPLSPTVARPGAGIVAKGGEARAEIENVDFRMEYPGYTYSFATKNGIRAQERGFEDKDALKVEGSFEYMSPEGTPVKLYYLADEMGFHPQGVHLPVAPAVPEDILRSIQWNEQHPEEEKEWSY